MKDANANSKTKRNKEEVKNASDMNLTSLTSLLSVFRKKKKKKEAKVLAVVLEAKQHSKPNHQWFASKLGWHLKCCSICPMTSSGECSYLDWMQIYLQKTTLKNVQVIYTNVRGVTALWKTESDFKLMLINSSKLARWNYIEEGMKCIGRSEDLGHTH